MKTEEEIREAMEAVGLVATILMTRGYMERSSDYGFVAAALAWAIDEPDASGYSNPVPEIIRKCRKAIGESKK